MGKPQQSDGPASEPGPEEADAMGGLVPWGLSCLMGLPVMVLAGGLGGILLGGTVIFASVRLCEGAQSHVTKYALPLLLAAGSLLGFLVLAGVAESMVAGPGS